MKSKIFKILFILSFIPYVYMLYSILCGRYTLNGVEINGIDRILNRAAFVFPYYVRNVPIIPACLTFQMCYLNRKKGNMMFMCTFIPLLFTLLVGLLCVFGGASLMGKPIYGLLIHLRFNHTHFPYMSNLSNRIPNFKKSKKTIGMTRRQKMGTAYLAK